MEGVKVCHAMPPRVKHVLSWRSWAFLGGFVKGCPGEPGHRKGSLFGSCGMAVLEADIPQILHFRQENPEVLSERR